MTNHPNAYGTMPGRQAKSRNRGFSDQYRSWFS